VSPRLVLASTSRYRAELLARLEVPFEALAPAFDEEAEIARFDALGPAGFAAHLARGKAASLRAVRPDAWILAADQIGVQEQGGRAVLLRKPGSEEAARAQLASLAGRSHELLTAVVLVGPGGAPRSEALGHYRLHMRDFSPDEAARYVARHRPLDCAGGYRIEDAGIALFDRIESDDYTGIVGLPLIAVSKLLREAGLL
jgi:septum formation protein